jgi:hypothetical protein
MLRTKLLAGFLALTVALPTLAVADPSHNNDWRGPDAERYERGANAERYGDARRAYEEGWRDATRQARRDRRGDWRRGERRYDYDRRYDDDAWRRSRDELSPTDIIIPLLLR